MSITRVVLVLLVVLRTVLTQADTLDHSISMHRMGTITIETEPGAQVRVEQVRHAFWFGAALSSRAFSGGLSSADKRHYEQTFLANFNAAVTENAVKWHSMERQRGKVDHSIVEAMLAWTDTHGIPLRGHCLFWGIPNRVQNWLKQLDDDELSTVLEHRATSMGKRYRGRIAEFDLNNEMIHGNYYRDRLGDGITKQMADWVRQGDSGAKLFLNDYDILTGKRLEDYVAHIRTLLDQGVALSGIGVQGHLHGESFDPRALQQALDTLAQFGLPIRVTEFNLPGQRSAYYNKRNVTLTPQQETAKAKALAEYYRICFAHPAVSGILMWGFWEGANWIPQSSLYRRDWSPTPAAEAYRDLVYDQWWTNWQGTTDARGRCQVPVFFGQHRITVDGQEKTVDLTKPQGSLTVSFKANSPQAQRLASYDKRYNSKEHLITCNIGSKYNYNTHMRNTTAHETRGSLAYAVLLLDSEQPDRLTRAQAVIDCVLDFQDTDPKSPNFGIWSKYLEESLTEAPYVDRNWADFLGKDLLWIYQFHRHRLDPALVTRIEQGIHNAATAIRRRNVGPGYTNIAIMGTYVTMIAAEQLNDPDLLAYALARLKRFCEYTEHHGTFSEYNSPTYTTVALQDLARFRSHAQDPAARQMVDDLFRKAWEVVALHFHAPTQQWGGPHCRAYSNLLRESALTCIERWTSSVVDFGLGVDRGDPDVERVDARCPADLEHTLTTLNEPRQLDMLIRRESHGNQIGTTYLHPEFALSSMNFEDMWNQRRSIIAYWGTPEEPAYMRLRFLHDGYDFTSAYCWSRQQAGRILAGIGFANNAGDKHPSLDMVKGRRFRAEDLRLRFEFGGVAANATFQPPRSLQESVKVQSGRITTALAVPFAQFGNHLGHWEVTRENDTLVLDVVLYHGEEREFEFDTIHTAGLGVALQIDINPAVFVEPAYRRGADALELNWSGMSLRTPLTPMPNKEIIRWKRPVNVLN